MPNNNIQWAAQLSNVRDVSVRGFANLNYWTDYLEPYSLKPAVCEDKAEIIIIGGDARFRGVAFRELSFALILDPDHAANCKEAAFLLHAFSSCWCFAFCERVFFSTPYTHANVSLSTSFPASMCIEIGKDDVFRIAMGSGESGLRQPTFSGRDAWEGGVYLPYDPNKKSPSGKMFFSRIQGDARKYSFDLSGDTISIQPVSSTDVLAKLVESDFSPHEWITRDSSTHAKSKTYPASKCV